MKWRFLIALTVAIAIFVTMLAWQRTFSREATIRFHIDGWNESIRHHISGFRKPLLAFFDRRSAVTFYHDEAMAHEEALRKAGYLIDVEFRLTNQVITREFSTNFNRQLFGTLGTNGPVWRCAGLPNRMGLKATLPATNLTEWERIFHECAARYASNIPPALSTNAP